MMDIGVIVALVGVTILGVTSVLEEILDAQRAA